MDEYLSMRKYYESLFSRKIYASLGKYINFPYEIPLPTHRAQCHQTHPIAHTPPLTRVLHICPCGYALYHADRETVAIYYSESINPGSIQE